MIDIEILVGIIIILVGLIIGIVVYDYQANNILDTNFSSNLKKDRVLQIKSSMIF